ncbi:MAG: hypothetical protein HOW73_18690 [Polyangiaceae bacterium]|nr:hypothetical protein [Polyangiaceae bacterium]
MSGEPRPRGEAERRVWVLNLDAEIEIEGRTPYPGPFAALASRPELAQNLIQLVPDGDIVLRGSIKERLDGHLVGRAWCLTSTARRALQRIGAEVPAQPTHEVLERVTSRAFSSSLGLLLDGARFFPSASVLGDVLQTIDAKPSWLARRNYGFAGRGRRAVRRGPLQEADLGFIRRALREGGLLLEPLVKRSADFSLHGYVRGGEIVLGEPTVSEVDTGGVWRGSRRADRDELRAREREELVEQARIAAKALDAHGYEGAFGVDAFRYVDDGAERFCPRCEINARYSMGWAVGMGDRRPDL